MKFQLVEKGEHTEEFPITIVCTNNLLSPYPFIFAWGVLTVHIQELVTRCMLLKSTMIKLSGRVGTRNKWKVRDMQIGDRLGWKQMDFPKYKYDKV